VQLLPIPMLNENRRERFTAYAETLHQRFKKGILKNMQDKPLWCLYKLEQDEQGNIHKRPYTPRNYPASIYKPRQWASLANVLEVLATGDFHVAGIGMMLPAPYILIDQDATPDAPVYDREAKKIVHPLALRLVEQVPSYFELSPNNGLHSITVGRPTRGNFKTESLEMYTNWFTTVTTKHIPGTPLDVTSQQQAIELLENEFHPIVAEASFQNTGGVGGVARLDALPPEAVSDAVLQELLSGDMNRYGNDHHRADWVLLMKLLHWTGDDVSLSKQIFLDSPLGRRAKAQEPEREGRRGNTNYVDRTIERIIAKRWNPPQRR
jgi:primase-polymerase (primpol)-like protein